MVEKVTVLIPIPRGIEIKRKTKYKDYKIGENVNVYFVKYFNPLFPLAYNQLKWIWIWSEFKSIRRFLRQRQISFDLIHAHFTWPSGALAVELKKEFNVPVVLTEHTHLTLYKRVRQKDRLYFNTWKGCDAIIRVTKKDLSVFKKFNCNVYAVSNGFNPNKINSQPKILSRSFLNLPSDKKIVFSFSRLYEEKGFKYLIQAMKKISTVRDDVLCFIGGKGPLQSQLQNQINAQGLEEKVKLIGFVPDNLVKYWLNSADIFALSSLSETGPVVMYEALGSGLPFVGTIVGSVPEVITSRQYGLVCPPKDVESLTDNILTALDMKWNSDKIKEYAQKYTWDNIAKQCMKIYQQVL